MSKITINELDYSKMSIEQLRQIAEPLLNPEIFTNNLLINNSAIKNTHFVPGIINHTYHNGYLYCIHVTPDNITAGIVEIKDNKVYAICVLPEYRKNGIADELLKDAKNYASEIYGKFVPEMINKVWKFYHDM